MKISREFRQINQFERKIIETSISEISLKVLSILENENKRFHILLNDHGPDSRYPLVFLVSSHLTKIIDKMTAINKIESTGLYFGMIKKGKFYLSLEGTEFLFNHDCFLDEQVIIINKSGEKAILYGNKILKRMLREIPQNLKKNNFLLFFNESHELLSIGNSLVDYNESQKIDSNGVIAHNLVDKGYYLRRKQ